MRFKCGNEEEIIINENEKAVKIKLNFGLNYGICKNCEDERVYMSRKHGNVKSLCSVQV